LTDGNYSSAAVLQNLKAHKELYATYYINWPIQFINCIALHNKRKSHFSLLFYNMYMPFSNVFNKKVVKIFLKRKNVP